MIPAHAFPFSSPRYEMAMGTRPLGAADRTLDVTPAYAGEIACKRALLESAPQYYAAALPASLAAQWEALDELGRIAAYEFPAAFAYAADGTERTFANLLTGERSSFRFGDCGACRGAPLDWIGRHLQEDVLVLSATDGVPLVAGQLCFGSSWSLDEKLGKPLLAIHAPVPGFNATIGTPSQRLLERLRPERPVWRVNWTIVATDRLDLSPRNAAWVRAQRALVDERNAGERCFLRVERQTLHRLERANAVLFTIHTYVESIASVCATPERAGLVLGNLTTAPQQTLHYKGIDDFAAPLFAYVGARVQAVAR